MRDRVVIVDILTRKFKSISYKQYDNNNELNIVVYEGKTLVDISNYVASVYFELPSGKVYEVEGTIENNTIKVMLSSSILEEYGQVNVECELFDLDEVVTTFTFYLNVEKSINKVSALSPSTQHKHLNLDVLNQITQEMVDSMSLSGGLVDLSIYQTKKDTTLETDDKTVTGAINELNEKIENISENIDLSDYALKEEIPTKISELTNDSNFVDENYVTEQLKNVTVDLTDYYNKNEVDEMLENVEVDLTDYALKSQIPTKTSQLTNDSNFLTSIPNEYITEDELEEKGYLTEHQDLTDYALKSELPTVPTKTSQLTNDSGYLTEIPSKYITEEELETKLGDYALKTEIIEQPNFEFKINLIKSEEEANVVTSGTYPNMTFTLNIPSCLVKDPATEKMWIGYIPYDSTGVAGISSLDQIGSGITMKEIQFGLDAGTMQELEPQTLGKTSTGIVPESCYICCVFPKSSGYTVTIDNGIGGKETFADNHGQYPVNNLELDNQIDGFDYLVSGFLTSMEGERFLYVD